ncbi:hypothetical protein IGI37_000609 [Enterococcus sp. AZ194]|uniref:SpaA isopeptide-forming pilin-related protein n=1 Tax=Enterococcus sp. AZ194 TaxID=2774629 RepID=UPI003F220C40
MRKTTQFKQVVAVLLPIFFLLGMVLTFPKGESLKADDSEQPFAKVKLAGKTETLTDRFVKEELVKVVLIGKKTTLLQLPDHASYDVYQTTEEGTRFAIAEKRVTDVDELLKKQASEAEPTTSESQETEASSTKETESAEMLEEGIEPALFHVASENGKGKTYFQVVEGKALTFTIERKSMEEIPLILTSAQEEERSQRLFTFESVASTETTHSSKEIHSSETSEQMETSTKAPVVSENTSETSSEAGKQKQSMSSSEETKPHSKESPKQQGTETPEIYNHVSEVETKPTKKTLDELTSANYKEADSLKTPLFFGKEPKAINKSDADSPIIIRDAKLTTKTGTADFDANNDPGNDAGEDNDLVRTFDQIGYLVSFSIQNTKVDTEYTDIRYRVITEMPNAVEVTNTVPRNNGEIANGTYIDRPTEDGSKVSEGVMESVITDSGQVFVPIILNVYGAIHGQQIQPTIQLEIVEAKNVKTGEVETFNKKYDLNELPNLKTPITKVSAKPSVGIRLFQGDVKDSSVFGVTNSNINAYDVGVVTVLQPLPGRNDYKGSTFPTGPITYQIKQKGAYQIGANAEQAMTTAQYSPFSMKAYSPAINDRSKADWKKSGTVDTSKFVRPLNIPNANTKKIYTSQPTEDLSQIGVYSSGSFSNTDSNYVTDVKNSDYVGVLNPYTYNMTGNRTSAAMDKAFSSMELIYQWDKTTTYNTGIKNKWTQYRIGLSVESVSYDGITISNDSTVWFQDVVTPPGSYGSSPNIGVPTVGGVYGTRWGEKYSSASVGKTTVETGVGNAQVSQGQKAALFDYAKTTNTTIVKESEHILMWDPSAFKFDMTRTAYGNPYTIKNIVETYQYGVPITPDKTSPYTMQVGKVADNKKLYTWYDTPEEASSNGEIGAVTYKATFDHDPDQSVWASKYLQTGPLIPVTVIAKPGSKTPKGNPIVILAAHQFLDKNGDMLYEGPNEGLDHPGKSGYYTSDKKYGTYVPSTFDSSGNLLTKNMEYWNYIGDTIFVKNMAITTKTEVVKSLYQSNEDIDIKVTGVMTGSDTVTYDGALTTTLPKGISYKPKTSTDATGNPLPEPIVTSDANGTTTLRWVFSKLSNDQRQKGIEVNFQATSDFTQLTFKDSGYTNSLVVKTVGEMWVNGDPSLSDTSVEGVRASQDDFIELLIQQLILSKKADKPSIEVGDIDPVGIDNRLTYTVKMVNNSAGPLPNVKLLDVLPYDGDSRGTKFKGTYTVESVKVNDPSSKISYTTTSVDEQMDPNDVTGWTDYTGGAASKNAKGILVSTPSLAVGQTVELTITLKPIGQKAGDVLVNDAGMNSDLHLPVNSQAVWTRVYGRDLSGIVWYDDNYDGLIGHRANGSPELFAKNIPVKLYRSSLSDTAYKDQLVEASLTGEKFVDASGNSLVQTDTNGFYTFANLPEGTYVAEFIIGEKVVKKEVQITTPEVGDDPTKNSKASQETYKTPGYLQPLLADLPEKTTPTDSVHHITDVNLGLIRSSTIRLFKYASGTAVDANKDGVLSDVEKATGTPLAGAEFTIYQEGKALGTAVTDSKGFLTFDFFFRGTYTLIETKAPDGYELVKHPIEVEISEGNETILLYQEDEPLTKLPYTGGNGPVRLFLLTSASLFLIGLIGIAWYYRTPKQKGER